MSLEKNQLFFSHRLYDIRKYLLIRSTGGRWPSFKEQIPNFSLLMFFGIFLIIIGGLLRRIQGGWISFTDDSQSSSEELIRQLIFTIGTGILVFLISGRFPFTFVFSFLFYFGATIEWGCYFSMPDVPSHSPDCQSIHPRYDTYDWLLGHVSSINDPNWHWARKWARDWCSLTLRGIMWCSPPGLCLWFNGFGWLFVVGGALMAPIHQFGYILPFKINNFSQGMEISQLFWGCMIWLLLLLSFLGGNSKPKCTVPTCCKRPDRPEDSPLVSENLWDEYDSHAPVTTGTKNHLLSVSDTADSFDGVMEEIRNTRVLWSIMCTRGEVIMRWVAITSICISLGLGIYAFIENGAYN